MVCQQAAYLIGLSDVRFYNKPIFDMPTKANFSTVVFVQATDPERTYRKDNLLGVSREVEYNGFMSDATKRKIKRLVTNYATAVKHAEREGVCLVQTETMENRQLQTTDNAAQEHFAESRKMINGQHCGSPHVVRNAVKDFHKSKSNGAMQRRLNFLTLTLPSKQVHGDNKIKRECLNRTLIDLQRNCDIVMWIWVAELQKNGNIHFHLIIDNFIPFVVISRNGDKIEFAGTMNKCKIYCKNKLNFGKKIINYAEYIWNNSLDKLGYIDSFAKKFGNRYPPTTQIEAIKCHEAAGKYITKYITKNDSKNTKNNRKIEGRLWGCCDKLKEFENIDVTNEITEDIIITVQREGKLVVEEDFVTVFVIDVMTIVPIYNKVFDMYLGILEKMYPT